MELTGLDISLSQAPPQEWMPSNVKLRTWNLFDEPPQDLEGRFDVLHVRLIILVIRDNNLVPIIQNLLKLLSKCSPTSDPAQSVSVPANFFFWALEPGGYLQWDEMNTKDSSFICLDSSTKHPALEATYHTLFSQHSKGLDG